MSAPNPPPEPITPKFTAADLIERAGFDVVSTRNGGGDSFHVAQLRPALAALRHDLVAADPDTRLITRCLLRERLRDLGWTPDDAGLLAREATDGRSAPATSGATVRWYSVAELAELTPPASLIGDVIVEGSLVLMYGQWGTGKTFLALDMALSKAAGHNWHGVELTPGPVAYILAEGRGGIAARVQAWHEAHGIPDDISFSLLPQRVDFLDLSQVAALLASVKAWPHPPKLLFVDTMYRCFGGNENDTEDMNAFLANLARFQGETGAAVVVIHHPGHEAQRGRGHSAFPQAVDTIIKVVESEGVITMSCDKQRDGLPFEKRRFRLSSRAGSMTIELAADTSDDLSPNTVSALATLNKIAASGGASNKKWKTATQLKDRTFQRVAKTLFEGGWVEKSNEGCYLVTEKLPPDTSSPPCV